MPYQHLTPMERGQIQALLGQGLSQNAIARKLGRSPSTISRELRRNGTVFRRYDAGHAQRRYQTVRQLCVRGRSLDYLPLRQYVIERFMEGYSPEQVSGRLSIDCPGQPRMRVSHESIYRTIYADEKLCRILLGCLRQRHSRRRRRGERKPVRSMIPNRIGIEDRPVQVETLERYGDWEGDTVVGKNQEGAILTMVERKSMMLLADVLPLKTAQATARSAIGLLERMPPGWLRTITFDNGSEFSGHTTITQTTGIDVYFAHPYSSWERARNENTNGLLRQYYPKKTSFANLDPAALQRVVNEINNRPRKKLGCRTPLEVFREQTVALDV
jgi:IS30 family transposase